MAGDLIRFIDLPGIRELEERCRLAFDNRLMADELAQLERDLDNKSLELFGITANDTLWDPRGNPFADGWQDNFTFLDWVYDEEPEFWTAFDLDMTGDDGDELYCVEHFGRQLVCALKQLHPEATLTFRTTNLTAEQTQAAAEAWGRALLRP